MPDRAARPETELSGTEVEITPEMIEAGSNLLVNSGLVWYREPEEATHELVREIFAAMLRLIDSCPDRRP